MPLLLLALLLGACTPTPPPPESSERPGASAKGGPATSAPVVPPRGAPSDGAEGSVPSARDPEAEQPDTGEDDPEAGDPGLEISEDVLPEDEDEDEDEDDLSLPDLLDMPPRRPADRLGDETELEEGSDELPDKLTLPPLRPADAYDPGVVIKPDLTTSAARQCETDEDCVISCAMDCCVAPEACRTAVSKSWLPAIEAWGKRDCPDSACPEVDEPPAPGVERAECHQGQCVPALGADPAP
ncbi:MAG: hypothetical protein EA397_11860 [Deltaproteobacteria bacterium]|nr:MAG: hypothetical protein EA397_11860 [Deltaproteobacteria bacterium]